jgi:O-antigen ligase
VLLLLFTPLAFGTVEIWAISVMELVCLVMVAVWLVSGAAGGERVRFRFPLGVPVLLFTGLAFAQILVNWFGGSAASLGTSPLLRVATTSFFSSKTAFVKLVCYVGLYVCLVNTLTTRREIVGVLMAIVVIGSGVSFLGLLQRLGGTEKIFWLVQMPPERAGFMAAFVNENHFAGYMELVIPVTFSLVLLYLFRVKESGWRGLLASSDLQKAMVLSFLAVIMIVSLVLSESRGGLIGFVSSLLLMTVLLLCKRFHRKRALAITVLLTFAILMLVWIGLSDFLKVWGTLGNVPRDRSFLRRMEIAEATWKAVGDYPFWGSGLGTFETVFPNYGTQRFEQVSKTRAILHTNPHAENDYLQTLLETGWVGMTICLLGIVLFFQIALRTYLARRRTSISLPAMGGAVSIFAILVHSFSDFNLRIDANALLAVTIVAMVVSLSRVERGSHHHGEPEGRSR